MGALLLIASGPGASVASAQASIADSLAGVLASPDIHARAVAVARLDALPVAELTSGARSALVGLLDAEATHAVAPDPNQIPDEDETYDEYIIDLTSVVLKLHDPAAIRGLTLVGIQTNEDVQRYIASAGARSLPALDEAWQADPDDRPTIVTTWSFMLGVGAPDALSAQDRQRVLASIFAATDSFPIAVAGAARVASLTALEPVLADLAATATSDVVRSRAAKAVAVLGPARDAAMPAQLLGGTSDLVDAFCARPGLANTARVHPNRPAACGKISADMNEAAAALNVSRPDDAKTALANASATAATARGTGALSAAEAAVIAGNVAYLLTRF